VTHVSLPVDRRARPTSSDEVHSERSASALVADHFDFVWRLLRRLGLARDDADDAAQQVFMIAAQKLEQISAGSARSFLYGIALRVAANTRRAAQRRRDAAEAMLAETRAAELATDERAELARAWTLLDELLDELRPELRRVIVLAEVEQLEMTEIAVLEKIPVGTVASRLRRARAELRELLLAQRSRNPFKAGA
jgi:RNA polymerase sigma-70 factor, ECF subfamily